MVSCELICGCLQNWNAAGTGAVGWVPERAEVRVHRIDTDAGGWAEQRPAEEEYEPHRHHDKPKVSVEA